MSLHTKEPWYCSNGVNNMAAVVHDNQGTMVIDCLDAAPYKSTSECQENARRIVAAVNACAGIPIKILEDMDLGHLKTALIFYGAHRP